MSVYFCKAVFLSPVVLVTLFCSQKLYVKYGRGSKSLTLERARAIDEKHNVSGSLNPLAYKQKVLTEGIAEPLPYRTEQRSLREAIAIANEDFDTL